MSKPLNSRFENVKRMIGVCNPAHDGDMVGYLGDDFADNQDEKK